MPPKGSRGRGTAARGRGGRGKASEEGSSTFAAAGAIKTEPTPQSTLETADIPQATGSTTPQHLQDVNPSPNSSPATVPTETPAPTPARPTEQREGSVASASSSVPAAAVRGAKKPAGQTRFKPKIVRREQGEREELAREELKRKEAAAAQMARDEARASRGRGRGLRGRGRGDAMGKGRDERKTTASGTFGVAPGEIRKIGSQGITSSRPSGPSQSGGGGGGGGGGFGGSGGSGIKTERRGSGGGGGSGNRNDKDWFPEPAYPDEEDGPRIDIETINISSDDEDDVVMTSSRQINKGKALQKGGLKPVRLHREEHKERTTVVNTDSSTEPVAKKESDDPDKDVVNAELSRSSGQEDAEFKGVYQEPSDSIAIKQDPDAPVVPGSPEESKKKLVKHAAPDTAIDIDTPEPAQAKTQTKSIRRNSKKKEKKPVIQTEEDRAEYARHLEDVAILARELGGMQTDTVPTTRDLGGDVDMDAVPKDESHTREGRLYLFQFPPVLPKLYNPSKSTKPGTDGPAVKNEESFEVDIDKNVQMSGASQGLKVDLTGADGKEIKTEEEIPMSKDQDNKRPGERDAVVTEEGYVGKLVVRESGKVELIWGGTNLVVGRGVDAGFLTTGVVVDSNQRGVHPGSQQQVEGKALGMGKVMGKFVVTPDWEKM